MSTTAGRVEGSKRGRHVAFLGMPYAKPPVGSLRFRAPEPPDAWSGVRPARAYGPSAMQGVEFIAGASAEGPASEDCLYVNVFTPAPDGARRPVLFWIHGGAFTIGSASSPLYDGGPLVEMGDVVVVTVNYRLGALGFLHLGEAGAAWGASANAGLLDLMLALRWVRDNIAHFGGDPDNVTVFGESAGATAACLLLASPRANGLFHRVISQSSAATLRLPGIAETAPITEQFLNALGLRSSDAEALQRAPVEAIMRAQAEVESGARSWRGFFPVLDEASLPEHPGAVLESGARADVPLVIGTNRDEWNLFDVANVATWNKPLSDDDAVADLRSKLPAPIADEAGTLLEAYRASRGAVGLPNDNRALIRAIEGDQRFRIPSVRFAEAHGRHCPATYMYLFTHASPALRGILGACHAIDLPFVFGTLDAPMQAQFAGEGPGVENLSRVMMSAWLAFARSSDPNHPGLPEWKPFETKERWTMLLDVEPRLRSAPLDDERRAWQRLI